MYERHCLQDEKTKTVNMSPQVSTLMMASAQVVETSVNTNNSPSQDYTTNSDDHSNHNQVSTLQCKSAKFCNA